MQPMGDGSDSRVVSDGKCRWLVRESSAWDLDWQSPCLIAACEQSIRRIWMYPADWLAMSDSALAALIHARVTRPGRSTPAAKSGRDGPEMGSASWQGSATSPER